MKVLFLTNMYPTKEEKYYGIFVKEQYEYINNNYDFETDIYVLKGKNIIKKYFNLIMLYKKIKKFNPSIIHIHYGLTGLPLLLISPFIKNIKIVVTYHGSDINGNKIVFFISKILNMYANYNIAVSQEIFQKISSLSKNREWIPCGIDNIFFEKTTSIKRKNIVIFPSSPNREVKNYPLFKKTMEIVNLKYNLTPDIVFFDSKSRNEIKICLQEAKCLLMTSFSEGSPQVIKEAIACNTPVISTPVGDVPYLLKDLDNCFIEESAEKLAEKVFFLLNSNSTIYPDKIKKVLSNKFVCNRIVKIYKNIL